jgi:hypothetical protein
MGLKVSTIARLPISTDRDYFVYFLDYGWEEPLSRAMYENFDKMAEIASENRGLIICGLHRQEFANEVLSWHGVNGESAEGILPAIMITDTEPRLVADSNRDFGRAGNRPAERNSIQNMIVIPLKLLCNSPSDVADLLSKIARDMKDKKSISDFEVIKLVSKRDHGLADMVILKPSLAGIGIDLVKAFQLGKQYWSKIKSEKPFP